MPRRCRGISLPPALRALGMTGWVSRHAHKAYRPQKGAVGFVLLRVQRKEEHLGEENDQEEVMMIEVKQTECTPAPKASAV